MINVDIVLKNIGYGVATNIKFYNLLDGKQVYGNQKSDSSQNQKLFTFDIGESEEKKVSAQIVSSIIDKDKIIVEKIITEYYVFIKT